MSNTLIGIHGLSNKPAPEVLADWWEKAIKEGLLKNEGVIEPQINFSSVYWADVTYEKPDDKPDKYKEADTGALMTYEESWLDSIKSGIFDWSGDIFDSMKKYFGVDKVAEKVLERKLKDLSKYYTDKARVQR